MARAACSGKGLLFHSKQEDSAIEGIIDLTRVGRFSESNSISNHFEMLLRQSTQLLYFKTGTASPKDWVSSIVTRKNASHDLLCRWALV